MIDPDALATSMNKMRGKSTDDAPPPTTLAEALAQVRSAAVPPHPPRTPAKAPVASGRKWWERR